MSTTYLFALTPFILLWIFCFLDRKDLRTEILTMSLILGVGSFVGAYFWWTKDWWTPMTITGTLFGIEDFLLGFFSGGLMVSLYEILFRKKLQNMKHVDHHLGIIVILLLGCTVSLFFWGLKFSSFIATSMALVLGTIVIIRNRKDLFQVGLYSAFLTLIVSSLFYIFIHMLSKEWIIHTYSFPLSEVALYGIPVEEFIFWFLAGFFWGPFYEYWQGKKLKNLN